MIGKHLSHYLIESELGRGGMGIVYLATDTKLDRQVAIKVLPSAALASDDDRSRFYREAKAAAALTHPHIAIIHGVDEAVPEDAPHGTEPSPFIAMEFIDGETLEEKIKQGPLKLDEAVRIAIEVASALKLAHENEIVHRDIKAANIMLAKDGSAKVLDFGLAQTAQSTKLTRLGSTLGTAAYMSPEQARGESVDRRSDLWSLGVVLYELITGRPPFSTEYEQAALYSILNEDPAPMTSIRAGVPMSLDWIVAKLLAKNADERYQSASELMVDLKSADLTQAGLSRMSTVSAMPASDLGGGATKPAQNAESQTVITRYLPYALLVLGLAVGAAIMSTMTPEEEPAPVRYMHRSLDSFRNSRWPALSESGRYLAIAGQDSFEVQPFLRVFDLQNNTSVPIPNSRTPSWPVFSKDESQIAFVSSGQLKIADLTGGTPLEISAAREEMILWSEDNSVYFLSSSLQLMVLRPTGGVEAFMPAGIPVINLYPNAILPGGHTMIVLRNEDDGRVAAFAMNLDTGDLNEIIHEGAWYLRYVNSGHLVVQSGENDRLSAVPFSVDDLKVIGLAQPVISEVSRWDWFVTNSGHLVSYGNKNAGLMEMVEFEEDGSVTRLFEKNLDYEEFQISSSGDQLIAEVNGYENGRDQILLFDFKSGTSRQVTFDGLYFEPTFSPDGERIAMISNNGGAQNIAELKINGTGELNWLTSNSNVTGAPDWSPTGAFIAYDEASVDSETDIWIYSFSDSSQHLVVEDPGSQMFPRISHDGKFIAYQSDQTRATEVFVVDMETGAKTLITQDGGFRPVWGLNGESLYYSLGNTLMVVDVSITDGFRVLGKPRSAIEVGDEFYFDVSDQGRIVVARRQSRGSVVVEIVQNWSSTLEDDR